MVVAVPVKEHRQVGEHLHLRILQLEHRPLDAGRVGDHLVPEQKFAVADAAGIKLPVGFLVEAVIGVAFLIPPERIDHLFVKASLFSVGFALRSAARDVQDFGIGAEPIVYHSDKIAAYRYVFLLLIVGRDAAGLAETTGIGFQV